MTVKALAEQLGCKTVCLPYPDKEIDGAYVGDLLSWVMGNAEQGHVWITIMSNINTVAVATLVDASCILLCEDVTPDGDVVEVARSKSVNILTTSLSSYRAAIALSEILK